MALSTDPQTGDDYLVYVTGTIPADDAAAKLTANYDQVGLADQISLDSIAEEIETRYFGGVSVKYGSNKITGSLRASAPVLLDDGQDALTAAHEAQPKTLVAYLVQTGVPGSKGYHGTAYVGGEAFSAQAGNESAKLSWTLGVVTKVPFTVAA